MEDFHEAGKARAIGVSNFGAGQLRALLGDARLKVAPHYVQNRCQHKAGYDAEVRELCAGRDPPIRYQVSR